MKLQNIVIDTNVIVSALKSRRGTSLKLLALVGTGLFEIHVSIPLILEYKEVLTRQRVDLGLSQEDVEDVVDAFCALAKRHEQVYYRWRPFLPGCRR